MFLFDITDHVDKLPDFNTTINYQTPIKQANLAFMRYQCKNRTHRILFICWLQGPASNQIRRKHHYYN